MCRAKLKSSACKHSNFRCNASTSGAGRLASLCGLGARPRLCLELCLPLGLDAALCDPRSCWRGGWAPTERAWRPATMFMCKSLTRRSMLSANLHNFWCSLIGAADSTRSNNSSKPLHFSSKKSWMFFSTSSNCSWASSISKICFLNKSAFWDNSIVCSWRLVARASRLDARSSTWARKLTSCSPFKRMTLFIFCMALSTSARDASLASSTACKCCWPGTLPIHSSTCCMRDSRWSMRPGRQRLFWCIEARRRAKQMTMGGERLDAQRLCEARGWTPNGRVGGEKVDAQRWGVYA